MSYTPQTQVGLGTTVKWTPTTGTATPFLSAVSAKPAIPTVGVAEAPLLNAFLKPKLPTVADPGEGTIKVNHWDGDPGCSAMIAATNGSALAPTGAFLITFPSTATLSIPGFPTKYEIDEVDPENPITATISYQQTGVATYAPPSTGS